MGRLLITCFSIGLILVLLMAGAFYLASDQMQLNQIFGQYKSAVSVPDFPDELILKDKNNRSIEAVLLARSEVHIEFRRIKDNQHFVYPIDLLSQESRVAITRYPVSGIENAEKYLQNGSLDLEAVYIEQIRERITAIDEEIKLLNLKLTNNASAHQINSAQNKIKALLEKRIDLEEKILTRRSNSSLKEAPVRRSPSEATEIPKVESISQLLNQITN